MTKSELIALLAGRFPQLAARDADLAVKTMLDAMARALSNGQRIEIRGFGSFSLSQRAARVGRNPKSGEQVHVPAKMVPHFKPGKGLREQVDGQAKVAADAPDGARAAVAAPVARVLQDQD